jgi:hypothetical protein
MSQQKTRLLNRLAIVLSLGLVSAAIAQKAETDPHLPAAQTLDLVGRWVHGYYDNQAQADRDFAADLPDAEQHRLMHQLFAPVNVDVPDLPGYLVFQQSSTDGSLDPEWIVRVGLLQFFVDQQLGMVRQRELSFKTPRAFFNAHLAPSKLAELTPEDVTFDAACDFLLLVEPNGGVVSGDIPAGGCRLFNEGLGRDMIADDRLEIRPDQYWFRGRYVDEAGQVMWGTTSAELNKLVRVRNLEVPGDGASTAP